MAVSEHVSDKYISMMARRGEGVRGYSGYDAPEIAYRFYGPLSGIMKIAKNKLFDRLIGCFVFSGSQLIKVNLVAKNGDSWDYIVERNGEIVFDDQHTFYFNFTDEHTNRALAEQFNDFGSINVHVVEIDFAKYADNIPGFY